LLVLGIFFRIFLAVSTLVRGIFPPNFLHVCGFVLVKLFGIFFAILALVG
jgi:hypothetical protein